MQKISAPRKGDGILDKLLKKQASLKEAIAHIENREGRVGDLANDLEALTAKEAKLDSRRKYYMLYPTTPRSSAQSQRNGSDFIGNREHQRAY